MEATTATGGVSFVAAGTDGGSAEDGDPNDEDTDDELSNDDDGSDDRLSMTGNTEDTTESDDSPRDEDEANDVECDDDDDDDDDGREETEADREDEDDDEVEEWTLAESRVSTSSSSTTSHFRQLTTILDWTPASTENRATFKNNNFISKLSNRTRPRPPVQIQRSVELISA